MPTPRVIRTPSARGAASALAAVAVVCPLALVLSLVTVSCGPTTSAASSARTDSLAAPVVYANVKHIFDDNCVMCHSKADDGEPPAEGLFLDAFPFRQVDEKTGQLKPQTHQAIVAKVVDRVQRRPGDATNGKGRMPPKGQPLTAAEVQLLKQWLASGAN